MDMEKQKLTRDVMLLFPPLGNHEHPHMGLPVLKAYLAHNGISGCYIRDYNAVIMNRMFVKLMTDNSDLFGVAGTDVYNNYIQARQIMKGNTPSDQLKAGMAMKIIAKYLRLAGIEICKQSFDPTSFYAIADELKKTELDSNPNPVLTYIRDEVLLDIKRRNPSVIGISVVFASQIYYSMVLCREIRKTLPDTKIFLGGPQASLFWKAFLNNDDFKNLFDVIVREQGELSTLKLLKFWLNKEGNISSVPNLAFYSDEQGIVLNEIIPSVAMDDVVRPDYGDMPLEMYAYSKLPHMLSRGCYWGRCKFCGYRGDKAHYIKTSVGKIVEDLKAMKEMYNIRIFHLMDDALPAKYLNEVAEEIIRQELDICYAAFLRTDPDFTFDVCKTLYKSGLRTVLFGFESANERVLKIMDKGMNLETAKNVLKNFADAGIMNTLSCIIGFPTETKTEAQETIDFLKENRHLYYEAYITPFRLMSDMVNCPDDFQIYDVDFLNPIRHDINGYVSLEYSYRSKQGMTAFEYMEMVKKARQVTETAPVGAIYFR